MNKKQRIAMIGIGRIANKYLAPLMENPAYDFVAVCDINESAREIAETYHILFYTDYQQMLSDTAIDLVIITTPPQTHFEIAETCLLHGKNVILEKPAEFRLNELQTLMDLAEENKLVFDVIFHWKYGNEVLYLKDRLKDFGEITRIESNVFDPYTDEIHQIRAENAAMGGTWFDSGINCLSLISEFVDISQMNLLEKHFVFDDKNRLDIYSKHRYRADGVDVAITVDWRYNMNHKYTCIYFKNDVLYMDHSGQRVFLNNALLADLNEGDRLENHYRNYFARFNERQVDHQKIYHIHDLLLKDGAGTF